MNELLTREYGVNLRILEIDDAEWVHNLRLTEKVRMHLSGPASSVDDQRTWLERYKEREKSLLEFYFAIQFHGDDIGVVRVYDIEGDKFTWGSWAVMPKTPSFVAPITAVLVYDFSFHTRELTLARFDTRKANKGVVNFHACYGARTIGTTDQDVLFELTREEYAESRKQLLKFADILR